MLELSFLGAWTRRGQHAKVDLMGLILIRRPKSHGLKLHERRGVRSKVALGAAGTLSVGLLVGCGNSAGSGSPGELGEGSFRHECVIAGDAVCVRAGAIDQFELTASLGTDDTLPNAVAAGSRFGLNYAGTIRERGDEVQVMVAPVSPKDQVSSGLFSISQPAEASFIARTSRETIVDFATIVAREAFALSIWADEARRAAVVLSAGEIETLAVAPEDEFGLLLGGALPYTWEIEDVSVAAIRRVDDSGGDDEVRNVGQIHIEAKESGATRLRVSSRGLVEEIDVEVKP